MKIKKEFMLRNICGEEALVPVGETAKSFKGIIKVNDIGSFIWNNLIILKNECARSCFRKLSKIMD